MPKFMRLTERRYSVRAKKTREFLKKRDTKKTKMNKNLYLGTYSQKYLYIFILRNYKKFIQ